jgi:hypothetical protein
MRALLILGVLLGLFPAARGQDKLPSEQAQPISLLAAAQSFPRAVKPLEQGKFEEALQVLRSFSDRDDLYRCDCYDAPHFHRSAERPLLIVRCLLAQGKKDDARRELRALYEKRIEPGYLIPGTADLLLVDLETATGYEDFAKWLAKVCPTDRKSYTGSIQEMADLKKAIEAGRYEQAMEILMSFPDYHQWLAPRRPADRQRAVVAYFTRNPKSLDHLLGKVEALFAAERSGPEDCSSLGWIYCLGEMGDTRAVAVLRKARKVARNTHVRKELLLALAKLGDKQTVPELISFRGGCLAHQQFVDRLLRWVTGTSQGDISSLEDADSVFRRWGTWLEKNPLPKDEKPR